MKIVPPEPSVNLYEDGFENPDLLQRERLGAALSDLLNRIDDPLVIALDGKWGTGKTYFLKRWVGAHARRHGGSVTTVYFDAFAHDHFSDPLPALVSALEERISRPDADESTAEVEEKIRAMKKAAFRLAKPLARAGLAAAGAGNFLDVIDELGKAGDDEAAGRSDRFWEAQERRRAAMETFRNAIESLAASEDNSGTGSTVAVVVDELDRCRPDYALEVLEVIKHFFAVPRLHFVLGVNLPALEDMVRTRYGSRIDAHAYLSKFIQVRLELPDEFDDAHRRERAILLYLDHLVGDMGIPQQIAEELRRQIEIVSGSNHVSLRDIGAIVSSVSLVNGDILEKAQEGSLFWVWIMVMIDLVVSRIVRPELHPKFLHATVTPSELESYLGATENVLQNELDGQNNPDYDHDISLRYHIWIFLSRNGRITEDDPEILKYIPRLFSNHGFRVVHAPRSLPMKFHRDWLDRFSFYRAT